MVEGSSLPVQQTLAELDIPRSTFYRWYNRYLELGYEGLFDRQPQQRQFWNRIPQAVREQVVQFALQYPEQSPRELSSAEFVLVGRWIDRQLPLAVVLRGIQDFAGRPRRLEGVELSVEQSYQYYPQAMAL